MDKWWVNDVVFERLLVKKAWMQVGDKSTLGCLDIVVLGGVSAGLQWLINW
jgi:hypothetical protein